ncbi:hypothetical protein BJ165DRAFT_113026 [Panaeolus papilionaceus]|nr:hypothetical protein BJ165DRAFT_113026 [Panaeolus papilionaceus]
MSPNILIYDLLVSFSYSPRIYFITCAWHHSSPPDFYPTPIYESPPIIYLLIRILTISPFFHLYSVHYIVLLFVVNYIILRVFFLLSDCDLFESFVWLATSLGLLIDILLMQIHPR